MTNLSGVNGTITSTSSALPLHRASPRGVNEICLYLLCVVGAAPGGRQLPADHCSYANPNRFPLRVRDHTAVKSARDFEDVVGWGQRRLGRKCTTYAAMSVVKAYVMFAGVRRGRGPRVASETCDRHEVEHARPVIDNLSKTLS